METKFRLSVRHVDTCLPDYVSDHCNGDSEWLCGIPVDHTTRNGDVFRAVLDECRSYGDKLPDAITAHDVRRAVEYEFDGLDKRAAFKSRPDKPQGDGYGDSVYAWFRFSWESA